MRNLMDTPISRPVAKAFRAFTRDNSIWTFDNAVQTFDTRGNHRGKPFEHAYRSHDGKTYDSTGAFLVGELERLDQTMHPPLAAVTYLRDLDLREDVTIADEQSSFTNSTFAAGGSLGTGNGVGGGKSWGGKRTTQVAGIGLDISKTPQPLTLWELEIAYSIPELESAARLGRPIDQQKYEALLLKHAMDCDAQAYVGDTALNVKGLLNSAAVTNVANAAAGVSGFTTWAQKSPDEILADINTALVSAYTQAAFAVMSNRILIPPAQYGQIATQKVSQAGNISVLQYVLENNLLARNQGNKLEIYPVKWCIGAGVGGTLGTTGTVDRMCVYTKDKDRVRFPMTMLSRTPLQFQGIYQMSTYYGRLGVTEVVYPDLVAYVDGI